MKHSGYSTAVVISYILIAVILFASCKKSPIELQPQTGNKRPVANAGIDQVITLPADNIVLSGSGTDADGNIEGYNWRIVSGPSSFTIVHPNLPVTELKDLIKGVYVFEFEVTDNDGLTAIDIVKITLDANCTTENDFDLSIVSSYNIKNDFSPYDDPGFYYDLTIIEGKGIFQRIGEFDFYVHEISDTAASSNAVYESWISINTLNQKYIYGEMLDVNFKKLIKDGGGSFAGTFSVKLGSALLCDPNVFTNLPPLIVTGSLDTATHIVTLRIQGKAYF